MTPTQLIESFNDWTKRRNDENNEFRQQIYAHIKTFLTRWKLNRLDFSQFIEDDEGFYVELIDKHNIADYAHIEGVEVTSNGDVIISASGETDWPEVYADALCIDDVAGVLEILAELDAELSKGTFVIRKEVPEADGNKFVRGTAVPADDRSRVSALLENAVAAVEGATSAMDRALAAATGIVSELQEKLNPGDDEPKYVDLTAEDTALEYYSVIEDRSFLVLGVRVRKVDGRDRLQIFAAGDCDTKTEKELRREDSVFWFTPETGVEDSTIFLAELLEELRKAVGDVPDSEE